MIQSETAVQTQDTRFTENPFTEVPLAENPFGAEVAAVAAGQTASMPGQVAATAEAAAATAGQTTAVAGQTASQAAPAYELPSEAQEDVYQKNVPTRDHLREREPFYQQQTLADLNVISKEEMLRFKIVGQVFDTYWIFEYGSEMYIVKIGRAHV